MLQSDIKAYALTGKVLCDAGIADIERALYAVCGVSYNEIGLVRLFEQCNMNSVLERKCYKLVRKLSAVTAGVSMNLPLYVDVTTIVTKEKRLLLPLLESGKAICRISKEDMRHIISLIRGPGTIPESIKSKYLVS